MFDPDDYELHEAQKYARKMTKERDEAREAVDRLTAELEDLRNVLRKLVEHDVTYWDNKGEVRHDVGASQSEAMAIFREARQLLTPNA